MFTIVTTDQNHCSTPKKHHPADKKKKIESGAAPNSKYFAKLGASYHGTKY